MDDFLEQAFDDANVSERDDRKLLPLAAARKIVSAAAAFKNGDDRLWAALLSLENGDEFVREASRLKWKGTPRGMDNIAPFQRYGAAILPWLATRFDRKKKVLSDDPWCVAPCLANIGTREAFAIALDAEELESNGDFESIDQLVTTMIDRFPGVGWPMLAERVLAGDARAAAMFKKMVKGRSSSALRAVSDALGGDARKAIETKLKISAKLEAGDILGLLDRAAAQQQSWPLFNHDFELTLEYVALRIVAARDGDRWGIALERLTGGDWDHFSVQRFVFGSEVTPGMLPDQPSPEVKIEGPAEYDADTAVGSTIRGPAGVVTLTAADLKTMKLHPAKGTEPDSGAPQLVLLRAYVARYPGKIWLPIADTMAALNMPGVKPMLVTEDFAHVGDSDAVPSRSKTYKSLADAIIANEPKKFVPGKSNTDWRKHLVDE